MTLTVVARGSLITLSNSRASANTKGIINACKRVSAVCVTKVRILVLLPITTPYLLSKVLAFFFLNYYNYKIIVCSYMCAGFASLVKNLRQVQ